LPVRTSIGRCSRRGASSQPMRQPVIEKYLLKLPKTTASRDVAQAQRARCSPAGAYSIPW